MQSEKDQIKSFDTFPFPPTSLALHTIIAVGATHTGCTPLIGFFSSDVWFSCVGDVFMLIKKISDTPESCALSERKPELCSREGESWCVLIPQDFFSYQIYTFFSV